jgi:hypothetical protein
MPTASRLTHDEREQTVLTDLETNFPQFMGTLESWNKVPAGQDPPDFIGINSGGNLGLELVEWLDGEQMTLAKGRESQRDQVRRVLATNWESEYQPVHFRGAFLISGNERISREDEAPLRKEFFTHAAEVDGGWPSNPERSENCYYASEFPGYRLMAKYFNVRYIGGEPHGLCWIHTEGDGGAYDPEAAVDALNGALDKKLTDYSAAPKQAHLKGHDLAELNLLVHGGFNAYAYNTPAGPLSLEEIARRGSDFYSAHPKRHIFNRVWFFNSLDSADALNQLIGIPAGRGRSRFLARLWPDFRVY